MIQNTLFILGAGASCPYGLPSGRELREAIIARHIEDCRLYLNSKEGIKPEVVIEQHLNEAGTFVEAFRKSSTMSIDLFLARRPEFSRQGKRAIILRIHDAELESHFRERAPHRDQDWYTWLSQQLTDKIVKPKDFERFDENDVSFITFNYDRSLEHFLYDSFVNAFGIGEAKTIEHLNNIKICHIFGKLAPLEWQGPNSVGYRANVNEFSVDSLCENIKIVHEEGENPKLKEAQEMICKAHRIFFLGFGYAEENLDALGIPVTLNLFVEVHGTALGLTKKESTRVESSLGKNVDDRRKLLTIYDLDCLALLRECL